MQAIRTTPAPVPYSMAGGATKRTLSRRQALPSRTMLSTFSQTLSSRPGLPTQFAHLQGQSCNVCCMLPNYNGLSSPNQFVLSFFRPMRGSDPLTSPAAGEGASPGNWMLTMPSASSSTPFSPVQPVYDTQCRAQQHQMNSKHTSQLNYKTTVAAGLTTSFLSYFALQHTDTWPISVLQAMTVVVITFKDAAH